MSISDKTLNSRELNKFINEKISFLIHSKLPFITIEQLNLGDISDPQKHLVNLNAFKELLGCKEYQSDQFGYVNDLNTYEFLEFQSNDNSNTYYYESFNQDDHSSVNLDERENFNSFECNALSLIEKLE